MEKISSSRRIRVHDDTFVLPDMNGTVYFRNNTGSFRMEGKSIEQWVERLLPLLNGDYTLAELTEGLPEAHRDRVYEIASLLYKNGFARDITEDQPHSLSKHILQRFSAQISFLDNVNGSGAYLFEQYRKAKVLAVGPRTAAASLIASAFESGLAELTLYVTNADEESLAEQSLAEQSLAEQSELITAVHENYADARIHFLSHPELASTTGLDDPTVWTRLLQSFDGVVFLADKSAPETMSYLEKIEGFCRNNKRVFLPAVTTGAEAFVGPQTNAQTETGSWNAMWRRLHTAPQDTSLFGPGGNLELSATATAVLTNILVFELFKSLTDVTDLSEAQYRFYRLNLDSLEGEWHSYIPRPVLGKQLTMQPVSSVAALLGTADIPADMAEQLNFFEQLTETTSGIFHLWDEGSLIQLPLSLCRVQPVDPNSTGPGQLLVEKTCAGLTHEQARIEAGLAGLEDYVTAAVGKEASMADFVGIGTGTTAAHGLWRALRKSLHHEFSERTKRFFTQHQSPKVVPVHIVAIEDEICDFYLQVLHTLQIDPEVGLGNEVLGFPVVWLHLKDSVVGAVGLNPTTALRSTLEHVLLQRAVGDKSQPYTHDFVLETGSWDWVEDKKQELTIHQSDQVPTDSQLQNSLTTLHQHGMTPRVFDAAIEPFLERMTAGVYGIVLAGEESQ